MDISKDDIEVIASVCHQANKGICEATGDLSQKDWDEAEEWQKNSCIAGVNFLITHPNAKPEHSHESWLLHRSVEGWKFGPEKDAEKKEHPCMVPYEKLPVHQRIKDHVFHAIVRTALKAITVGEQTE